MDKRKILRYFRLVTAMTIFVLFGCQTEPPRSSPYRGEFHAAIAGVDRIVVIDGPFIDDDEVDVDPALFEVKNIAEVQEAVANLHFERFQVPCACLGFPRIDWYKGNTRIAITSVQHGKALRWNGDLSLTPASAVWVKQWLLDHGVKDDEIELGCGGPRSARRNPIKWARTALNQGEVHAAVGDLDAAITDFTKAIECDANCALAYYSRGLAHEKKGNLDQSIQDLTEAIRLSRPDIADSRAKAAGLVDVPSLSMDLTGKLGEVYHARGRVYEKKDDATKAQQDFNQARTLGYDPN